VVVVVVVVVVTHSLKKCTAMDEFVLLAVIIHMPTQRGLNGLTV